MFEGQNINMMSGSELPGMCKLELDFENPSEKFFYLFFTLTEMWLLYNCKSPWFMTSKDNPALFSKHTGLIIGFANPKEAMLFKLTSPIYVSHITLKKQLTDFINFLGF